MTLEAFLALPSIREDFPKVADAVDKLLVEHLLATARNARGGKNAKAEVGAQKAIANIIQFFRTANNPAKETPTKISLKPLRRFDGNNPKADKVKPKTP